MKRSLPLIASLLLLSCFPAWMMAQNAPITTIATVVASGPGTVSVPMTVINFSGIGAISLSIDYDYSGINFVSGTPNSSLPGFAINDNNLGNGKHRIIMGWYSTTGVSLSSGSTIMTMNFNYINGNDSLNFFENGASCEYADANSNVLNDIPQSTYYINGFICGGIGAPGTISGNTSVCQGQTGVNYSISPLTNTIGYFWTVPTGASITSGLNTNSISVDFGMSAVSGNVTVNGFNQCGNGPNASLPVTVNTLPVANAYNDTTIPYGTSTILHAANGGTGTFSYHWEPAALLINPNVQDPQTVILTSTVVFTLTVINQASLCQNTDQKIVNISGGALSVNPVAIPSALCQGESSVLYSNAGGGSGNYTYSWTCVPPGNPPWSSNLPNPTVFPEVTTVYNLSVFDGFTTVTGSTTVTVYALPTATISGGDTLCGEGVTTTLTIDLTGSPPWSFLYTNGVITFPVNNQATTPYTFSTSLPGNYTVLWVHDSHCTGNTYGTATVAVFPIPPTPVITQAGTMLYSTACCGNQWYKDLVLIPGATDQTYTPTQTAHYRDIVTIDGCASDTSNDIYFCMTGIGNPGYDLLTIRPNPARERFTVISPFAVKNLSVKYYSTAGSLLKEDKGNAAAGSSEFTFDTSGLAPGIYMLQIKTDDYIMYKKLIIL